MLLYYSIKYTAAFECNYNVTRLIKTASLIPLLIVYLVASLPTGNDTLSTGATLIGIGVLVDNISNDNPHQSRGTMASACASIVVMACQIRDGNLPIGIVGLLCAIISVCGVLQSERISVIAKSFFSSVRLTRVYGVTKQNIPNIRTPQF